VAYNGNGPEATAGSDEQIDRKGTGTNLAATRGWSSYALCSGFTNEQKPRKRRYFVRKINYVSPFKICARATACGHPW
jgi:hypothetical protein